MHKQVSEAQVNAAVSKLAELIRTTTLKSGTVGNHIDALAEGVIDDLVGGEASGNEWLLAERTVVQRALILALSSGDPWRAQGLRNSNS